MKMRTWGLLALLILSVSLAACSSSGGLSDEIVFHARVNDLYQVFRMGADGQNPQQLTEGDYNNGFPVWSPDGTRIAFVSDREGGQLDIYTMDPFGENQLRLTDHAGLDRGPVWSPDGSEIAFVSNRDTTLSIFVMKADGSNLRLLTDTSGSDEAPVWTPDGQWVVFQSERGNRYDLYKVNVNTGETVQLTSTFNGDLLPDVSPDGASLIWALDLSGVAEEGSSEFVQRRVVAQANLDGEGLVYLADGAPMAGSPVWSPDGSLVAYRNETATGQSVYVINADGTDPHLVSLEYAGLGYLGWSADSSEVYFEAQTDEGMRIIVVKADGSDLRIYGIDGASDVGAPNWAGGR